MSLTDAGAPERAAGNAPTHPGRQRRSLTERLFAVRELSLFKVPRRFVAASDMDLDSLPRAANGKILRGRVQVAAVERLPHRS